MVMGAPVRAVAATMAGELMAIRSAAERAVLEGWQLLVGGDLWGGC